MQPKQYNTAVSSDYHLLKNIAVYITSAQQVPERQYLKSVASMRNSLSDELLPYHELKEVLSTLSGRLDGGLAKELQVSRQ